MPVIDLRALRPSDRFALVLASCENLGADEGFEFLDDHEPRGLLARLLELHGSGFEWQTLEAAPGAWRIRLTRRDTGFAPTASGALCGDACRCH